MRECRTKKREEAAAATENQSGQTAQQNTTTTKPENKPIGSTNAFEDDSDNGFFMADEDVARMYPYCAEPDPLSESEDESEDDVNEWEAFCTETWGTEDKDNLDCAGLDGRPVKEGEDTDVEEEAKEGTPHSESQLTPHTTLSVPQIGDKRPRTTFSCREQVADTVRHAHHLSRTTSYLHNPCLPFSYSISDRFSFAYITYLWNTLAFSRDFHKIP